tara:strand:+ start:434 stop:1768 length:1335 start_codon:yes stop_codon:yes gene_type:complete
MKYSNLIVFLFLSSAYSQTESIDCPIANDLFKSNDLSEAYAEIKKSSNLSVDCKYLAFKILFKMEDFDESKLYLDQLLSENPTNESYITSSDLLLKVLQKYKSAKYTLDKVDILESISEFKLLLEDPYLSSTSLFYSGLALAYKKQDQKESYSSMLNFEYLDLSVSNYQKAHAINSDKDYDKEILNISKFLTNLGKTSMKTDELESALKYFNKAIEYTPDYSTANFYLGSLYMKIQDYELAAQSFQKGLGKAIKDGNPKILYFLGQCNIKLGKNDLAVQYFKYAINKKINYIKAEFALANVYFSKQDYVNAEKYINQILNHDSSYIKAYELLVNIFIEKNDYSAAEKFALQGIEVNSKSYILFSQLSVIENENKNYPSAIEFSSKALSVKRNYGPALIELAKSNVNLCNRAAADDAFKRARSYDRRQVSKLQDWAIEHYKTVCK